MFLIRDNTIWNVYIQTKEGDKISRHKNTNIKLATRAHDLGGQKAHGSFEAKKENKEYDQHQGHFITTHTRSYPKNVAALLGAARRRQGPMPRKKPAMPSTASVLRAQSRAPVYLRLAGSKASVCNLDLMASKG